ncbi:hypothetical protein BLA17378_08616 [Burkholderia aenigmatica]|uniref:Uncharacterized protein n=1 Tax=Burkholderia aenigmatica TaxID=2015348 RepID=A0ABY6Y7F6_9BURK|nr:hypothetical protein [Burkholderia aenigmatica]VWD49559.1 hypothetical protein BLA17378_08616 [Burkholderia aenigmatica]
MYTMFLNMLRDMQHDAMVAWSYQRIDSASFMSWQPPVNVQQSLPNISGC